MSMSECLQAYIHLAVIRMEYGDVDISLKWSKISQALVLGVGPLHDRLPD